MKKSFVLFSIFIFSLTAKLFAQQIVPTKTILQTAKKSSQTTAQTLQGAQWNIVLAKDEEAEIELVPNAEELSTIKAINAAKRISNNGTPAAEKQTRGLTVLKGKNFRGPRLHSLSPADNGIAISKAGKIITVDNWNLQFADTNGTIIKDSIVWNDFLADSSIKTLYKYDPRALYDPKADRFIVIILLAASDTNKNKIAVAYSKTNDPMGGWNLYKLPGNPFHDSTWSDYPSVGINNDELFINVNAFKGPPSYNYRQSNIFQISLQEGYLGNASVTYKVWSGNIKLNNGKPGFTLVPAANGLGESQSPNMWFVAQWPDADNSVSTYQITGNLASSNSQLISYGFSVPAFSACANGFIKDIPTGLKDSISTGDSRIQNAYFLDSSIYYTFSGDVSGWCGIHFGQINLKTNAAKVISYGKTGTNLAFPSVAFIGNSIKEKSAAIVYLQSDTTVLPQVNAIGVADVNSASSFTLPFNCHVGDTALDILKAPQYVGYPERWGDYTGIQRQYGSNPPQVWCAGSYSANNSRKACFNTWVTQIINPSWPVSITPAPTAATSKVIVYPNPGYQAFTLQFDMPQTEKLLIEIRNIQGALVKTICNEIVEKGEQTLYFNKGMLPAGNYFIQLKASHLLKSISLQVQ